MELVNEHMGALATLPVQSDTVQHSVSDNQQTGGFQLSAKATNVEYRDPLFQVHIAAVTEDVQRTGGEQFQRKGNILCLRFRLFQQLQTQSGQRGHIANILCLLVDRCNTAVNDGLVLGTHTVLVDLLDQGHDELGLNHNGVALTVTVNHIHGVQLVLATGFQGNDRGIGTQGLNQCAVLVFRVTDQDFILRGKQNVCNLLFGEEGLACAGNTQ